MRIAVRTDSGLKIGSGHLMRCLALAAQLREKGAEFLFICRQLEGALSELVISSGYKLHKLPAPGDGCGGYLALPWEKDAEGTFAAINSWGPDWLIVDHYGIDCKWEKALKGKARRIMAIDDLADRRHECDLLLDYNYYPAGARPYEGLLPETCVKLIGPQYALLRKEFYEAPIRERDGSVDKVFICFGGVDAENETARALRAVKRLGDKKIKVNVVAGRGNPNREELEAFCSQAGFGFYPDPDNMPSLLSEADLSIGAGGTMLWERCFMGLPSIVEAIAGNQINSSKWLGEAGIIWNLGPKENVSEGDILRALENALKNKPAVREMSRKAAALMKDNRLCRKEITESIYG